MTFENLIFIGGIHGVGKSTICKSICDKVQIEYLSASKVLKWIDEENKNIDNISNNQDILISNLKKIVQNDKVYLLDGHYCLLNQSNKIENIPLETFKQLNPIIFIAIVEDVSIIKQRLESRDNRVYEWDLLKTFQDEEIAYAKYLSEKLCKPFYIFKSKDDLELITNIRQELKDKKRDG